MSLRRDGEAVVQISQASQKLASKESETASSGRSLRSKKSASAAIFLFWHGSHVDEFGSSRETAGDGAGSKVEAPIVVVGERGNFWLFKEGAFNFAPFTELCGKRWDVRVIGRSQAGGFWTMKSTPSFADEMNVIWNGKCTDESARREQNEL